MNKKGKNKKGKSHNKQARNGGNSPSTATPTPLTPPPLLSANTGCTDAGVKLASIDYGGWNDNDCGVDNKSPTLSTGRGQSLPQERPSNEQSFNQSGKLSNCDSGRESPGTDTAEVGKAVSLRSDTDAECTNQSTSACISPDSALDDENSGQSDSVVIDEDRNELGVPKLATPIARNAKGSDHAKGMRQPAAETSPLPSDIEHKPKELAKDSVRERQALVRSKTSVSSAAVRGTSGQSQTIAKRRPVPNMPLTAEKHPLEFEWSFWYSEPWQPWEFALVHVKDFAYIEDFWSLFNNLKPPTEVSVSYYLFKKGIRPEWEDAINESGGKWCLSNGDVNQDSLWQELVLMFIGGAALNELSSHINGIYFARKKTGATQVSVWLDTVDSVIVNSIGNIMRTTLQTYLKCDVPMDFTRHTASAVGSKKKPHRQASHLYQSRILT